MLRGEYKGGESFSLILMPKLEDIPLFQFDGNPNQTCGVLHASYTDFKNAYTFPCQIKSIPDIPDSFILSGKMAPVNVNETSRNLKDYHMILLNKNGAMAFKSALIKVA